MTNTPLANNILHRYIAQPGAIPRGAAEQISGRVLRMAEGSLPLLSLLQRRGQAEIGDLWGGPSAEFAWVRRQTVTAMSSVAEFAEAPSAGQSATLPVVRPLPKQPSAPILGEVASPAAAQVDAARASLVVPAPKAASKDRPIGDSSTTDASPRPVVRPATIQRDIDADSPVPVAALGSSILSRHLDRRVTRTLNTGNADISTIRAAGDVAHSVAGALASATEMPASVTVVQSAPDTVHLRRRADDVPPMYAAADDEGKSQPTAPTLPAHTGETAEAHPERAVVRAQQPPSDPAPLGAAPPIQASAAPPQTPPSSPAAGDTPPRQAVMAELQHATGEQTARSEQTASLPAPRNDAPLVRAHTAPTETQADVLVQRPVRQVRRKADLPSERTNVTPRPKGQLSTEARLLARVDHPRTTQKPNLLQRAEAIQPPASRDFASSTSAAHALPLGTRATNERMPQPPSLIPAATRSAANEPSQPLSTHRQATLADENWILQQGEHTLDAASFPEGSEPSAQVGLSREMLPTGQTSTPSAPTPPRTVILGAPVVQRKGRHVAASDDGAKVSAQAPSAAHPQPGEAMIWRKDDAAQERSLLDANQVVTVQAGGGSAGIHVNQASTPQPLRSDQIQTSGTVSSQESATKAGDDDGDSTTDASTVSRQQPAPAPSKKVLGFPGSFASSESQRTAPVYPTPNTIHRQVVTPIAAHRKDTQPSVVSSLPSVRVQTWRQSNDSSAGPHSAAGPRWRGTEMEPIVSRLHAQPHNVAQREDQPDEIASTFFPNKPQPIPTRDQAYPLPLRRGKSTTPSVDNGQSTGQFPWTVQRSPEQPSASTTAPTTSPTPTADTSAEPPTTTKNENPPVGADTADIERLADAVYALIEQRLIIERESMGL